MRVIIDKSQLENLGLNIRLGILTFSAKVQPRSTELDHHISMGLKKIKESDALSPYKEHPHLMATRNAYKFLKKDPSRYRPSSDALLRRVLSNKGFYAINNVVDLLNLCSVESQFSIGGYDLDQIEGAIKLVICNDQTYQAIGRGALNVKNLPLLADNVGLFGSPTSDSLRTSIQEGLRTCLLVVFDFGFSDLLNQFLSETAKQFETYCQATNLQYYIQ